MLPWTVLGVRGPLPCRRCSIGWAARAGINLETDGLFPRPPEPVPENLGDLGHLVRGTGAVMGLAVDPDVDRLALVDETGRAIGEDYTLAFAVEQCWMDAPPCGNNTRPWS